jgi:hypothetical protein
LTAFSMMALFVFAPAAFAQEAAEIVEELVEDPQEPVAENVIEGQQEAAVEEQIEAQQGAELTPAQEAAIEPQVEQQSAGVPAPAPAPAPAKEMPKTGGISVGSALLPAAGLLLLGSGVLVFAAVRRR